MTAKHVIPRIVMAITAALPVGGYAPIVAAQQSAPSNLFTAAGFMVRYADTPEKLSHLNRLPPDKLVTRTRNGKMYYVYADPTLCRCVYVGTPEAYRAFQTGADGSQSSGGSGSLASQMVDEMTDENMPTDPGAASFNDYVFGGMSDD